MPDPRWIWKRIDELLRQVGWDRNDLDDCSRDYYRRAFIALSFEEGIVILRSLTWLAGFKDSNTGGRTEMPSYYENRCRPARRTAHLLRLLCQQPMPPAKLAAELGMGKIQVYRYVWALQKEGVPIQIWRDSEGNGYKYVLDRVAYWEWLGGDSTVVPQRRKHARKKDARNPAAPSQRTPPQPTDFSASTDLGVNDFDIHKMPISQ